MAFSRLSHNYDSNDNTAIINNENNIALNNLTSNVVNANNDVVRTIHNKNSNGSVSTDDKLNIVSVPSSTFSYLNSTTNITNDNKSNSNSSSDGSRNPYDPSITNKNTNGTDIDTGTVVNSLKMELQIKETQIQALENEIQLYKKLINDELKSTQETTKYYYCNNKNNNNNHHPSGFANNSLLDSIEEDDDNDEDTLNKIIIPENVETILYTLSTKLKETQEKLKATEDHLESILCAIALNPSNSITKNGRYDIETIAHKVIVRLEILTKENKEMAKMLSYGKSKEISIELNLARRENIELKEKIKVLEDKISSLSRK